MKYIRIDKLGRAVIPKNYRNDLNIDETTQIAVTVEKGAVILRPTSARCKLCNAPLKEDTNPALCYDCIKAVKSIRTRI